MSRCRHDIRRVSIGISPAMEMALAILPKDDYKECWWLRMALSEAIFAYAACFEDGPKEGWEKFKMPLQCVDGPRRGLALEEEEEAIRNLLSNISEGVS